MVKLIVYMICFASELAMYCFAGEVLEQVVRKDKSQYIFQNNKPLGAIILWRNIIFKIFVTVCKLQSPVFRKRTNENISPNHSHIKRKLPENAKTKVFSYLSIHIFLFVFHIFLFHIFLLKALVVECQNAYYLWKRNQVWN